MKEPGLQCFVHRCSLSDYMLPFLYVLGGLERPNGVFLGGFGGLGASLGTMGAQSVPRSASFLQERRLWRDFGTPRQPNRLPN